jgi:hypothetical protein
MVLVHMKHWKSNSSVLKIRLETGRYISISCFSTLHEISIAGTQYLFTAPSSSMIGGDDAQAVVAGGSL